MIERLRLTGYKSIREFDQPLTPLTVLLGPNDAGKSSLLEALSLLGELSSSQFRDVFAGGKFPTDRAWQGAAEPRMEWNVTMGGTEYSLMLAPRPSGDIATREVLRSGNSTVFSAREDGQAVVSGKVILAVGEYLRTALCTLRSSLAAVEPSARELAATVRYELDPAELARASAFQPQATPRLGRRGYGLAGVLAAIKLADYQRFAQIESTLRETIPAIRSVIIRPTTLPEPPELAQLAAGVTGATGPRLHGGAGGHRLAFVLENTGWEVPAEQASAGVLLFLAYLTLVFSEAPPRHLLIEEPENGIHPRRLKTVLELLRRLTEGVAGAQPTQVIMTTHSPYLVDFVRPEEVLIFRKGPGGATEVTRMADAPDLEARLGEQDLGELWFNVGEDVLASAKKQQP